MSEHILLCADTCLSTFLPLFYASQTQNTQKLMNLTKVLSLLVASYHYSISNCNYILQTVLPLLMHAVSTIELQLFS